MGFNASKPKEVQESISSLPPLLFPLPEIQTIGSLKFIIVTVRNLITVKLAQMSTRKQAIYDKLISTLSEEDKNVEMMFARCLPNSPIPKVIFPLKPLEVIMQQNHYSYPKPQEDEKLWHINFADSYLFGFYNRNLFAQDEIQCAEHPLLCHMKELGMYNMETECIPFTIENDKETPVLIANVQHLGVIDTSADPSKNKPSIYGKQFAGATVEQILERTSVINPEDKALTNIIAMTALSGYQGQYTQKQILFTYRTALKSFRSAVQLSDKQKTVIHTGNWGCGAFGNNKQLIALIQLMAAKAAGASKIVYHTFTQQGTEDFMVGLKYYEDFIDAIENKKKFKPDKFNDEFVKYCQIFKFQWGFGDGN